LVFLCAEIGVIKEQRMLGGLFRRGALCALTFSVAAPMAAAETVRVVSYNIEADINGDTTPLPGLDTVLEAIGQEKYVGDNVEQPLDILGLEETTSNPVTVAPIVSDLNSFYGAGTYAASSVQATVSGSISGGNGPNAIIYNTKTLQLIASVGVGDTPTANSAPAGSRVNRQVMRYEFEPAGGTAVQAFYVYVAHMKSSVSDTGQDLLNDESDRTLEAQDIRADEATLPSNATFLYTGDLNLSGSFETAYQTLTQAATTIGTQVVTQGQAIDPDNASNDPTQTWIGSAFKTIETDSSTSLDFRDDLELMASSTFADTSPNGLNYISSSFHTFGNNGTYGQGSPTKASNTALNDLDPNGPFTISAVENALTTASDHLPVVGDYTINTSSVPEPATFSLLILGGAWTLGRRRCKS
jgi:hypothetical protein